MRREVRMPREHHPDIVGQTRDERLEKLKQEVADRLRPLCPNMPADEFDQMVAKIAAVELKYTYRYET